MLFPSLVIAAGFLEVHSINWCDEPPQIVSPKIIGGQLAPTENFTFQVAVVSLTGDGFGVLCGGTVIDDHWILTAAHCTGTDPNKLYILMGLSSLSAPQHTLRPKRFLRHPDFNEATVSNDIALVETRTSLYKKGATPVCITQDDSSLISGSQKAIVAGFGLHIVNSTPIGSADLVFLSKSDQLLSTSIPLIPISQCSMDWRRLSLGTVLLSNKQICAGGIMKGTSSGDSGGPLLVRDKYGRLIQVGITSFGASGIVGMLNQALYPGVYTRVSAYSDWIDLVTTSSSALSFPFFLSFLIQVIIFFY